MAPIGEILLSIWRFIWTDNCCGATSMEVHMDGQLLWGYLTGEQVCPSRPVLPTPPTYPPDATDDAKSALLEAFEGQMESYQSDLGAYETLPREEKAAKAILLASMEVDLLQSLRGLATSHLMWDHLCRSYEIRNEGCTLLLLRRIRRFVSLTLQLRTSTVRQLSGITSTVWALSSVVAVLAGAVIVTGTRETPFTFTSFSLGFAPSSRLSVHSC